MDHLIVDGMLSGTGVRDGMRGGYVSLSKLDISSGLVSRIENWLSAYELAHFNQFQDSTQNDRLDTEGKEIAKAVQAEIPKVDVSYFSSASMKKVDL